MPFDFDSQDPFKAGMDRFQAGASLGAGLSRARESGEKHWVREGILQGMQLQRDPLATEKFDLMKQAQELRAWQAQADLKEASARLDIEQQRQELRFQDADRKATAAWEAGAFTEWMTEQESNPDKDIAIPNFTSPEVLTMVMRYKQNKASSYAARKEIDSAEQAQKYLRAIATNQDQGIDAGLASRAATIMMGKPLNEQWAWISENRHLIPKSFAGGEVGTMTQVIGPDGKPMTLLQTGPQSVRPITQKETPEEELSRLRKRYAVETEEANKRKEFAASLQDRAQQLTSLRKERDTLKTSIDRRTKEVESAKDDPSKDGRLIEWNNKMQSILLSISELEKSAPSASIPEGATMELPGGGSATIIRRK
jgi:hypothetical protein